MSVLLLWLEGPLQSWGADSRYGNRTTLPFPTRSGVLGLLCCAAGRGGEQREWLARMADWTQTVRAYARRKGDRAALAPLLTDFQMVGSGYDEADAHHLDGGTVRRRTSSGVASFLRKPGHWRLRTSWLPGKTGLPC